MSEHVADASTLADFLRVAKRRKWIIAQAVVIVPVVAVLLSTQQTPLYSASAQVLLGRQNLSATLAGVPDVFAAQDPTRYASTQAFLARTPQVAKQVLFTAGVDRKPGELLGASSVTAADNADLLSFQVTDPDPQLAIMLANAYGRAFTAYRRTLDTSAIRRARNELKTRMAELERQGEREGSLYEELDSRQQDLATVEALQVSNTVFARPAGGVLRIQPRPRRDAMLGLLLGLALGVALAFLREALDTRLRTAEEVGTRLGMPLLGRLSAPPKRLRAGYDLVMLTEPYGVHAESFRMLRTNLDLANLNRKARAVMVTSALEEEGKTTTISNLAVAAARAGKHVVLVDLDLRRPAIDRFFAIPRRPGLTDVAVGDATLDEALIAIPIGDPLADPVLDRRSGGAMHPMGVLEVLTIGTVPSDPGEFSGGETLTKLLDTLRERADLVLIDTPPVLPVVDAMALSTRVDGIVVVTKLSQARRAPLSELRRLLDSVPTAKLGFVVADADDEPDFDLNGYSPKAYGNVQREYVS